jgi:hypothetical protein
MTTYDYRAKDAPSVTRRFLDPYTGELQQEWLDRIEVARRRARRQERFGWLRGPRVVRINIRLFPRTQRRLDAIEGELRTIIDEQKAARSLTQILVRQSLP